LGGVEGSILDVYGGQYDWDMFDVYLRKRRGTDKGITIEYGKNLTDLTQEESIESTYTGICPYWAGTVNNEPISVYLKEKVLLADNADKFPYNSIEVVDLTSKITLPEGTDKPTEDMVRKAAKAYMKVHSYGVPKVSLTVSFVDLAQTMEYEDFQNFEKVQLGDTVTVRFDSLGVNATAKVNKVTYDIINQRYIKIELGDARTDLSSAIANQQKELNDVGSATAGLSTTVASQQKQLDNVGNVADERINEQIKSLKNLEGHAFLHYNSNGRPYEFIVSDSEDLSVAKKVWRWNENGLAHSSTGYNGTYAGAAITADGSINADCITTGKITAVDIEGVNIKGAIIKGSEFSTEVGNTKEVISVSKGKVKTIIDSKATGSLYASYGVNEDGSTNGKRGVALSAEEGNMLWLSYRDGTDENGNNKYGNILAASGKDIKDGHTPWIVNTATGFMNFGKNHYGNGLQSHPNNYGIEIENGLIKRWSIPSGLVRESSVQGGDGDHDIAMGWNGSRLIIWVDGTFVCSLPSGYTP
jgi:phage-related protein